MLMRQWPVECCDAERRAAGWRGEWAPEPSLYMLLSLLKAYQEGAKFGYIACGSETQEGAFSQRARLRSRSDRFFARRTELESFLLERTG